MPRVDLRFNWKFHYRFIDSPIKHKTVLCHDSDTGSSSRLEEEKSKLFIEGAHIAEAVDRPQDSRLEDDMPKGLQSIKEVLNHTRYHRKMEEHHEKQKQLHESGGESKYMERHNEARLLSGNQQDYYAQTQTHNDLQN
ncbi:hypothetical protein PROFUN_04080 [Planoprotostelium fungivorum]|uniref:Uncharacterized protein n=1 Tax=Planoprotostelium fungivorum TaxID=1890364 RepID=A0A2P6NJI9_9EUKA|nr:hypothetical protein PROFUN_04080 [Planoprotostelium fungivorum]